VARDVVVEAERLTRRFASPSGDVVALDGVDVCVPRGSFTVVAGPSGSGKSTLLALVACTDRPDEGVLHVDGTDVLAADRRTRRELRRRRLGVVLAVPADNILDSLDAGGNLAWSARCRGVAPGTGAAAPAEAFAAVGLPPDIAAKRIAELSGGEQQRVALACALVGSPAVVVADEPTASLDHDSAAAVIDALRRATDGGATLLVASHDHHVIEAADVVVHLDHGRRLA
jgi:ABC-type lipoprotein export system ATPase subunit